ncbi:MAG: hypothetical protein ACRD0J_12760, partial [Acidimicrobiales bacterium]
LDAEIARVAAGDPLVERPYSFPRPQWLALVGPLKASPLKERAAMVASLIHHQSQVGPDSRPEELWDLASRWSPSHDKAKAIVDQRRAKHGRTPIPWDKLERGTVGRPGPGVAI